VWYISCVCCSAKEVGVSCKNVEGGSVWYVSCSLLKGEDGSLEL